MSKHPHDVPQEWPEHLRSDAAVSAVNKVSPVGEPLLDFSAMPASTFEQFCWWLLKKDQTLVGCKRLGGNGTAQGGIDLFAFGEKQSSKLSVFECKAWGEFSSTKLTEAVDAFLTGDWAASAEKFTIILAQQDIGAALAQRWKTEKERLKKAGIDGDLWTAHNLTLKVQLYPDILSKFFPWPSVAFFANQWMERVAFYEVVSKAFFDPRERVANWARMLVARSTLGDDASPTADDSKDHTESNDVSQRHRSVGSGTVGSTLVIDGTYRKIDQYGNSWHFNGPWFSLSVILPDRRFTRGSAAITFNRPDMEGITLTVDHNWLLERFLFRSGAPLTYQNRGFIVGAMPHNRNNFVVDLPNCRLSLQEDGVREIAAVADILTETMRSSLRALEDTWSAAGFPFVMSGGKKVALAAINANVWHEIGRFAEEHDVSNGTTEWHMFDGNRQVLKPYHETGGKHFDVGYHGVFYATEIEGLSFDREVVLLWQPNDLQPEQTFSPRGWWSCETAYQWLRERLLPEVKRRVYERQFGKRLKRILHAGEARAFAERLDELFVARDLRQPALYQDGHWSRGIHDSIQALQSFFHAVGAPEPYIQQHEIEALYHATAVLAQGGRGYVGYAGSKLGLDGNFADHADLINAIHRHVMQGRVVANCAVADNVFRAMLELLDDTDAWLSDSDRIMIREVITPFARIRDDATLVDRHTKWA
ncbi:hypothetical protein FUT88_03105 [Ralstonia sp. TCR112]|uniref:hypothetical protein n=1 Tax=Ralstonia sp. TCR112 TaxID=2601730 RepID=UPI0011BEBBB1|nr:hypothetical protein [Ralstonia sp. TCR112]TXD63273.1 hypothetical protein FUT88_03105 [Ralstonia sp. TCR112]